MILLDVNILLEAFMPDSDRHVATRRWVIDRCVRQGPTAIFEPVLSSVVRIATHPNSYPRPATLREAFRFCEMLRAGPTSRTVWPSQHHWAIYRSLVEDLRIMGGRATDAYLAALAIDLDATFYSFDKGFANYPGLKWRLPEI